MSAVDRLRSIYHNAKNRLLEQRLKQSTLRQVEQLLAASQPIQIDIGAGHTKRPAGWLTLDNNQCCDLYWDLVDGIPFPDHSVSTIYSSHVFEHIPPASLASLLRDCFRCLQPGGSLLVCVPNARLFIEAYLQDRYFVTQSTDNCWRPGWFETGSPIDQLNYIAYMGGEHRLMFDQVSLLSMFRQAGFERVASRNFQEGLDLPQRHFESIYAIGYKSS